MSITLKTRLHHGIYKSCGGGQTRIQREWAVGPLNLLRAVRSMEAHCRDMAVSYGNIGCGRSWLEIEGQEISDCDLPEAMDEARRLLAMVLAGGYPSHLADIAALADEFRAADRARFEAEAAAENAARDAFEVADLARVAAADAAVNATASAAWAVEQAAEQRAAETERAMIGARQNARMISRSMARDWRRAGC